MGFYDSLTLLQRWWVRGILIIPALISGSFISLTHHTQLKIEKTSRQGWQRPWENNWTVLLHVLLCGVLIVQHVENSSFWLSAWKICCSVAGICWNHLLTLHFSFYHHISFVCFPHDFSSLGLTANMYKLWSLKCKIQFCIAPKQMQWDVTVWKHL